MGSGLVQLYAWVFGTVKYKINIKYLVVGTIRNPIYAISSSFCMLTVQNQKLIGIIIYSCRLCSIVRHYRYQQLIKTGQGVRAK